jgi:hypothetical protein
MRPTLRSLEPGRICTALWILPAIRSISCSLRSDLTAAKLFLRLALSGTSDRRPRVINVDRHPGYTRAMVDLKQSGELGRRCRCRPSFCRMFPLQRVVGPYAKFGAVFPTFNNLIYFVECSSL